MCYHGSMVSCFWLLQTMRKTNPINPLSRFPSDSDLDVGIRVAHGAAIVRHRVGHPLGAADHPLDAAQLVAGLETWPTFVGFQTWSMRGRGKL